MVKTSGQVAQAFGQAFAAQANDLLKPGVRYVIDDPGGLLRDGAQSVRSAGKATTTVRDGSGRFVGSVYLQEADKAGKNTAAAFQVASAVTLQYYLEEINSELDKISARADLIVEDETGKLVAEGDAVQQQLAEVTLVAAMTGELNDAELVKLKQLDIAAAITFSKLIERLRRRAESVEEIAKRVNERADEVGPAPEAIERTGKLSGIRTSASSAWIQAADVRRRGTSTLKSKDLRSDATQVGEDMFQLTRLVESTILVGATRLSAASLIFHLADGEDRRQTYHSILVDRATQLTDVLEELDVKLDWPMLDDEVRARLFTGFDKIEEQLVQTGSDLALMRGALRSFAESVEATRSDAAVVVEVNEADERDGDPEIRVRYATQEEMATAS